MDFAARGYRALVVDNNGGQSLKLRMIWDVTDPKIIRWLNEGSVNGGPWTLIEECVCTPSK